jgi:hypothetical protein
LVSLAPFAAAVVADASHVDRAVGVCRFLVGIPGGLEPPAAPGEPAAAPSPWRLGGDDRPTGCRRAEAGGHPRAASFPENPVPG